MTASAEISKLTRWRPKKWEPVYEQIVIMSCLGRSHKEIAEHFNYTPQHVSNIVSTPEASMVRRRLLQVLQKKADYSVDERISSLADVAVMRLTEILTNDELMEKSPFAVVDRGLQLLKGTGHLKQEGLGGTNIKNAVFMTPEVSAQIAAGLKLADEAKQLHSGEPEEGKTEIVIEPNGTDPT